MIIKSTPTLKIYLSLLGAIFLLSFVPQPASGQGDVNQGVHLGTSVHRHNDTRGDVNQSYGNEFDVCYDPMTAGFFYGPVAAIAAAAVDSVVINGITYRRCNDVRYELDDSGSKATYRVVDPP